MKKLALLCVSIMLIGAVPAFAADPNPTGAIKQLQTQNPQLYQEIMNIKTQIKDNISKIKSLITQNKNLKNEIQNLKQANSTSQIDSVINQIKNNRDQIKSLHQQNKEFKKEIRDKIKNQTG
ncbi:MAG: hypothetical protein ACXVHY_01255 [Methanobacterium sp.]